MTGIEPKKPGAASGMPLDCKEGFHEQVRHPATISHASETVAMALWLAMDNLFCLLNFSYIGAALALGIALYIRKSERAWRVPAYLPHGRRRV